MFRKSTVIFLLMSLLSGCGKQERATEKALAFRTNLMQSQGCSYIADIMADYGERVYEFTVQVESTLDETKILVLSPDEISDISATITEHETCIEFDDAELDFGKMANGYISPVSAPWLLARCWIGEYISSSGADGEMEKVTYLKGYDEEELTVNTWLNAEGIPIQAEILFENRRCLAIAIRDFQF